MFKMNRQEVLTLADDVDYWGKVYTPEEFVAYWTLPDDPEYSTMTAYDSMLEDAAEHESQMRSEIAMFGDAWPGAMLQHQSRKAMINLVTARLLTFGAVFGSAKSA